MELLKVVVEDLEKWEQELEELAQYLLDWENELLNHESKPKTKSNSKGFRLTHEVAQQIVAEKKKGINNLQLATKFKVSYNTIRNVLRKNEA